MKKRFTLMMMVLCFLMSIPLKMMAYDKITAASHYKEGSNWKDENTNFIFTTDDGEIYTCVLKDVPEADANRGIYFRVVKNGTQYGPQSTEKDLELKSDYQQAYSGATKALLIKATAGKTYTITWNNETNQIKYDATGSGGTGGGSGDSGSTTVDWNTVATNRLTEKKRVYTQGFYLAGNFFTFDKDKVDGKYKINYDDAVFKFQQQNDQSISAVAENVYMVEIPASLTAHAQVMYVDETGKAVKVFGPTSACGISETYPTTEAKSTKWEILNGTEEFKENNNYWDFSTRNKPNIGYSDGLYEVYIAVDKRTHEPAKWMITHKADKRVAYFISDAPDATAIPLYDAYISDSQGGRFSNKFFATVNLAANRSYYVISNYVRDSGDADKAQSYEAFNPNLHAISCPTTTKLFMLGNAAKDIALTDDNNQFNQFSPNEKPMPGARSGKKQSVVIVEYNPSNGNRGNANLDNHFGIRGQVIVRSDRAELTSVSLVGDAIPGTLKYDEATGKNVWDYKSKAAVMEYDETEQCYKATVVTTVADDGNSKFRFVGNYSEDITWYEDSETDHSMMAKHPYNSTDATLLGHTADANDPNKVLYCEKGENKKSESNIIWNRPAGRWTVRLFFYTTSDGNNPKTVYYYTITASRDMELHDVVDVVYGSEDFKQHITNLGGYKFMRTWSAKKAWKISDKVDIFVVSNITDNASGVTMTLTKINGDATGVDNVIPANTGVILATKSDASEIKGAQFKSRQNFTSYNNLVIPMEEYSTNVEYLGENKLEPIYFSRVISSSDENNYNYLFGYYNTQIATGNKTDYEADEYLLGFWISKGSKPYSSNSSYLPIPKETAAKMNYLGKSYNDFLPGAPGGSAKKIPALLFDFANVGGTTGINEVLNQSTKLNDGKYYTLSGQQVEKPTAGGIYIHNGRKFVVK